MPTMAKRFERTLIFVFSSARPPGLEHKRRKRISHSEMLYAHISFLSSAFVRFPIPVN